MHFFHEYFAPASPDALQAPDTQWMTAAAIMKAVKSRAGNALKQTITMNKLGRELRALTGIATRMRNGMVEYAVRER